MNIYYPSILIFTLALILVYWLVPRFTPLIMVILSGGLLAFGVYHHYHLFKHEYQKTTWTDGMRIYAPAIMIGVTIMFILFGILAFFMRGAVPVPASPTVTSSLFPNVTSPPSQSKNITSNVIGSPITAAINAVTNVANTVSSGVTNSFNKASNMISGNNAAGSARKNNTKLF
jgi:predicted PurR-regulated permease PerM